MKKNIILISTLLFCSLMSSYAQVDKGKWFVSAYGSLNFDIGKEKYEENGSSTSEYNYFEVDFNPMAGYFVIDKLAAGLYFDSYLYNSQENGEDYKYTETQFIVGPFARYYILEYNHLFPYAQGSIGIGTYKEKYSDESDTYKETFFDTRLGAGASYFFTNHVAIDLFAGYDHHAWTHKYDEGSGVKSTLSNEETWLYGSFIMNIGIAVTFGQE
jgi:outer membrane protein